MVVLLVSGKSRIRMTSLLGRGENTRVGCWQQRLPARSGMSSKPRTPRTPPPARSHAGAPDTARCHRPCQQPVGHPPPPAPARTVRRSDTAAAWSACAHRDLLAIPVDEGDVHNLVRGLRVLPLVLAVGVGHCSRQSKARRCSAVKLQKNTAASMVIGERQMNARGVSFGVGAAHMSGPTTGRREAG